MFQGSAYEEEAGWRLYNPISAFTIANLNLCIWGKSKSHGGRKGARISSRSAEKVSEMLVLVHEEI